jgi:hypothetical protein
MAVSSVKENGVRNVSGFLNVTGKQNVTGVQRCWKNEFGAGGRYFEHMWL